eukprot:NODE_247_length_11822_cov_1.182718.p5 type:complete len:232 gc:universal NODE_247_length_11822_cov_1.182718:4864-4169(-)
MTKSTIAYHGFENNYSSLALKEFSGKAKLEASFSAISTYEELLQSSHPYAFLAIQNSSHTLSEMFRLIADHKWNVVGEYYWSKPLQLVGNSTDSSKLEHIVVVGHLASVCKQYLEKKKIHVIHVDDTAEACKLVADKKSEAYAAIAPKETADHYNLKTIVERVDDPNSLTRFFLVSKTEKLKLSGQPTKTTLIIRLQNRPGSLYKVIFTNLEYWMFRNKRNQHLSNRIFSF